MLTFVIVPMHLWDFSHVGIGHHFLIDCASGKIMPSFTYYYYYYYKNTVLMSFWLQTQAGIIIVASLPKMQAVCR